jgi:hypothetical protein
MSKTYKVIAVETKAVDFSGSWHLALPVDFMPWFREVTCSF